MRPRPTGGRLRSVWFCLLLAGCYWISDAERNERWDLDGDGVERPRDCDDSDPDAFDDQIFFRDADGDGFGDLTDAIEACAAPEGYVANSDDCDDDDQTRFPGASEICNGVDDDCDLAVDEDTALVRFYRDADDDGAGNVDDILEACVRPDGYVPVGDDCDDTNQDVNPDADEVCNGIDDDCDDDIDLDDSSLDPAEATWYEDGDMDGYGRDDRSVTSCDPVEGHVQIPGDCDDALDTVNPGADEYCNEADDDCDGYIDEDPIDATRSYLDNDGDGFGDASVSNDSCDPPLGYVPNGSDCDDDAPQTYPNADEWCDSGEDEDCDTMVDETPCIPIPPPTGTTGSTADTGGTGDTSDTATGGTGDTSDTAAGDTASTGDTGGGS